jgi:hypothetical protein
MFESRNQPPLTRFQFRLRLVRQGAVALALVALSLIAGMVGYAVTEHLSWLDAFLNSAMLLGGMGPVNNPVTRGGKLFAGLYALYSGLVFLIVAGVLFAPGIHRILHRFHWEGEHPGGDATDRGSPAA